MTARLLALLASGALLGGCGSGADPSDALRTDVAAMTAAANEGDADAVRRGADALLLTVAEQLEGEQLAADRAERLTALAQSVRAGADSIDADLLERQRAEAEAEAARQELAEAQQQLEQERARAEEERARVEQERADAEQDDREDEKGPKGDEGLKGEEGPKADDKDDDD